MTRENQGGRYLVFGAARSGLAAARFLNSRGCDVILFDQKSHEALEPFFRELIPLGIRCLAGEQDFSRILHDVQVLVPSPGVPMTHPLVREALCRGIEVSGEMEIGARNMEGTLCAVTGTNGKSTTVHLLAEFMKAAGRPSAPVGNVGYPISDAIMDSQLGSRHAVLAAEVSSYQLESVHDFHPAAAVLLNLSPDHLARHGSMENYQDCKFRITENQDHENVLILNADCPWCRPLAEKTRARVLWFSLEKPVEPGAFLKGDDLFLTQKGRADCLLISRKDLKIPGLHNVQNVLAASLAARALGVSPAILADVLRTFSGIEHRIEFVMTAGGVDYINDSKATNLDSLEKALSSFERPIVLLAGGRDKGDDYARLSPLLSRSVCHLVAMGEAADKIHEAWSSLVPSTRAASLAEAVDHAAKIATPGDVVLLSPACSSFDAFRDFEERGREFKRLVRERLDPDS